MTTRAKKTAPNAARSLSHLASRLFNVPLAIERNKLDVILHVLGPRLNLYQVPYADAGMLAESDERQPVHVTSDGIALIDVADTLVRKATGMDSLSGLTSYEQLQAEIVGALNDPRVRGVLATFDSPGGEVGGLFDLVDLLYSLRNTKPLYAAVSEMACSAAYALASTCDRIILTRTAAVGSIGVYALHIDESGADEKAGLKYTYVYAGAKKIDGNPHEPLSASAKAEFQTEIDRTNDLFVETVARNRRLSRNQVRSTDAGVFYGHDAIGNGLADQIGTPEEALTALRASIMAKQTRPVAVTGFVEAPNPISAFAEAILPELDKRAGQLAAETALSHFPVAAASAPNSTEEEKETDMAQLTSADATLDPQVKGAAPCDEEKMKTKKAAEPKNEPDGDEEEEPDGDEPPPEKPKGKKAITSVVSISARQEIREYCKLAGCEALAIEYIAKNMTVEQACAALTDVRAQESASVKMSSYVNPLKNGQSLKSLEAEAADYAQQNGMTKEQAYSKMIEANPEAYEAFSRDHAARALRYRLGENVTL